MQYKTIQYIVVGLIVAIIGGFGGWYFFITHKSGETESATKARGDADSAYAADTGSTYQNIAADQTGTTTAEIGKLAPRLWHVTKTPVAGFGFGSSPVGPIVFAAERATGNIFRIDPYTSSLVRLTNTLVPKVREALFSRSGDVILRTTNEEGVVTTFAATIATTTAITSTSTPNVLQGVYLPQDIVAIDVQNNQPTSKGLFFVTRLQDGGSMGVTSGWKGVGVKKVFTSPLYQWRTQWLADGRVVLTQDAADDIPGYSFMVSSTGVMKPIVGDVKGLTVLYHDTSDAYLYGESADGKRSLYVKVGKSDPVRLSIETTADKCVWTPGVGLIAYCAVPTESSGVAFLNNWYAGVSHTIDVWWKIEAAEGTAERFFVADSRSGFDVEDAQMDDSGSYIGFRNAADKSLWLLRLAE